MLARSYRAPACSDKSCLEGSCTCWPPCRKQGTAHPWSTGLPQRRVGCSLPQRRVGCSHSSRTGRQPACHGGQSPGASIKLSRREKTPSAPLLASAPPPRVKGQSRGPYHSTPVPPALVSPCRAVARFGRCLSPGCPPQLVFAEVEAPSSPRGTQMPSVMLPHCRAMGLCCNLPLQQHSHFSST